MSRPRHGSRPPSSLDGPGRRGTTIGHSRGVRAVAWIDWLNSQQYGVSEMQFGVFSVSDITTDPTTGRTPTEAERIQAVLQIAKKTEEVGLDVFALGEHHNPPFFSS